MPNISLNVSLIFHYFEFIEFTQFGLMWCREPTIKWKFHVYICSHRSWVHLKFYWIGMQRNCIVFYAGRHTKQMAIQEKLNRNYYLFANGKRTWYNHHHYYHHRKIMEMFQSFWVGCDGRVSATKSLFHFVQFSVELFPPTRH